MFTLRPEDPAFLETAPLRFAFEATLGAPAKAVFEALADDPTAWPTWFRAVRRTEYAGEGPYGVGTRRRVVLTGGVAFHETLIAWDAPTRFAYRIDRTTVPGFRAFAEEWTVEETPDGTRLRWATAVDAVRPVQLAVRAISPGIGLAFRRAASALDQKLAGS